jgi:hypothetical protein
MVDRRDAVDVASNVRSYLGDDLRLNPNERYASFDYCFKWFQQFHEAGRVDALVDSTNRQASCMQLGFYLASWGMYRGSTALHKRSAYHLLPVLDAIVSMPDEVWALDVDRYDEQSFDVLRDASRRIRAAIPEGASDILTTKILLGVFGCVPAFDTQFRRGFGVATFGRSAVSAIAAYYERHHEDVERLRVAALDFDTGEPASRQYTRAKVIDMVFFIEGGK